MYRIQERLMGGQSGGEPPRAEARAVTFMCREMGGSGGEGGEGGEAPPEEKFNNLGASPLGSLAL